MPEYAVRIAIRGMDSAWRLILVEARDAQRAILVAELRELQEGYAPFALKAENRNDPHDTATRGTWPFAP